MSILLKAHCTHLLMAIYRLMCYVKELNWFLEH